MDLLLIVMMALSPRPMMLASQPVSGSLENRGTAGEGNGLDVDILWLGDAQQTENLLGRRVGWNHFRSRLQALGRSPSWWNFLRFATMSSSENSERSRCCIVNADCNWLA